MNISINKGCISDRMKFVERLTVFLILKDYCKHMSPLSLCYKIQHLLISYFQSLPIFCFIEFEFSHIVCGHIIVIGAYIISICRYQLRRVCLFFLYIVYFVTINTVGHAVF